VSSLVLNRAQKRFLSRGLRRKDPEAVRCAERIETWIRRADDVVYVRALEDENVRVAETNREAQQGIDQVLANADVYRAFDLEEMKKRAELAELKVAALEAARIDIQELPRNLLDVLDLVHRSYIERIVATDAARASAEEADFQDPFIAWRLLRGLAVVLPDLMRSSVDIPREFQARTGFELSLTESKTTRGDSKLMKRRTAEFLGRQIQEHGHVKFGNRPPKLLRVHFAFHGSVVITHCGNHLDTAGTRRL
jgi:hypothetical protein